jgi:glutathione S-transferase
MITLFHHPKTRSSRVIFLLEELEAPYQIKLVTTRTRDGAGAVDPANPHPHGKVPAISDDGALVLESPAIALYLTDKFPKNRLGPLVGERDRAVYLSWLCYYTGVLEPAFMSKFMNVEVPRGTAGWVPVEEAMSAITKALSPGPYVLGERFSAADVLTVRRSPCSGNRAVSQALGQEIEALERRLKERVSLRPEYRLLKTVPGIGQTLATTPCRVESVQLCSLWCFAVYRPAHGSRLRMSAKHASRA